MTLNDLKQAGWVNEEGQPGPINPFVDILKKPDPVELSLGLEAGEIGLEEARKKAVEIEAAAPGRSAARGLPTTDMGHLLTGQIIRLDPEGRDKPSFALQTESGQIWGLPFIDPAVRKKMTGAVRLGQGSFNRETLKLDRIELDGEELNLSEEVDMGI
jgi:hypothetical protein